MTTFMDIAVVRIQRWLTRVATLRGRRGASAMIREATEPNEVDQFLRGKEHLATRCTEAGQIDGVIALQLYTDDETAINQLERDIVAHLRAKLPAASFESTRREGENWLAAQLADPVRAEWPAPTTEWPPARRCDWCHEWPASTTIKNTSEGHEALCIDCLQRHERAGNATRQHPEEIPGTERDLVERWQQRRGRGPHHVPNYFEELAKLGEVNDNTHLATVYADGNAIGAFREQVHDAQHDGGGTSFDLPRAIKHATWEALLDALEAITDDETALIPIIAHLVGGDDVLVSVPAHRAWRFVLTLQQSFTRTLADEVESCGLSSVSVPSVSAGIVFHHYQRPLAAVADLADELLSEAKKEHCGEKPALAWHSISHDGQQPLPNRRSVPRETLEEKWTLLDALYVQCGASARANLAALTGSDNRERLMAHAKRLGIVDHIRNFQAPSLPLQDALGMLRWWRLEDVDAPS